MGKIIAEKRDSFDPRNLRLKYMNKSKADAVYLWVFAWKCKLKKHVLILNAFALLKVLVFPSMKRINWKKCVYLM